MNTRLIALLLAATGLAGCMGQECYRCTTVSLADGKERDERSICDRNEIALLKKVEDYEFGAGPDEVAECTPE